MGKSDDKLSQSPYRVGRMLTPDELERLRRNGEEQAAHGRKAFGLEEPASSSPNMLAPEEKDEAR